MSSSDLTALPDFVILGAQKSASTFLQDQMAQHPSIDIASGESRHFEDQEYFNGGTEKVRELFSASGPGIVRGIKRPDYLGRPEVAPRIAKHLPHARLLVVIRDPISRAISSYYHFARRSFVPLLPLDEAFSRLLDGELANSYPRASEILTYGLYGQHIQRYLQFFPPDQLLVFDQHALIENPAASIRQAFEFVGVNPSFTPRPGKVSNQGVYSPLRLRLLRTKNHVQFRYTPSLDWRYPKRPRPLGYLWAASVVTIDRQVLARFDRTPQPRLPGDLADRLRSYYAADAELLATLLPEDRAPAWLA